MKNLGLSENHELLLVWGARAKDIPRNVVCPANCAFCYEARISELLPRFKVVYIPKYTNEAFYFYREARKYYEKNPLRAGGTYPLGPTALNKELLYYRDCDFFSLGLSPRQIEELILKHKKEKAKLDISTTGLNVDPKLIKYLTTTYSKYFDFRLSVITFDLTIRKRLMNSNIDIDNLKNIAALALKATFFFLFFSKKQMLQDIDIVKEFVLKNKGGIYIHKLYFNKLSKKNIINYATKAEEEFKEFIFYLNRHKKKFKKILHHISFSPDSRIYAYRWRNEIEQALQICQGQSKEAVFCSHGAYGIIKDYFKNRATHVVPIKNCLGGNIDFAGGMTFKAILEKIRKMLANDLKINHIYIPSSMFIVDYADCDLNGDGISLLKRAFPGLKVSIINIPYMEVIESVVSFEDCVKYYIRNS